LRCTDLTGLPANGAFYFQPFSGSVALPPAGYGYSIDWTPCMGRFLSRECPRVVSTFSSLQFLCSTWQPFLRPDPQPRVAGARRSGLGAVQGQACRWPPDGGQPWHASTLAAVGMTRSRGARVWCTNVRATSLYAVGQRPRTMMHDAHRQRSSEAAGPFSAPALSGHGVHQVTATTTGCTSRSPTRPLDNRSIECARGKVIGGSSSINAMAYVRGHRGDYDRWASRGLPSWSFDTVLPYFKRLENWEGGTDEYRGVGGPLNVEKNRYADPICDAFAEAGVAAGHPRTPDYNGAQQEGIGTWQTTRRNGRRCSAADAYLRPAMHRPNLTIMVDTFVQGVTFDGNRATGISCSQRGDALHLQADREVLIAAGTINSPQLLMLSGIGDPAHLKRHNIDVRVPLTGVGKNLQDHISSPVVYRRKEPGPLHSAMRADRVGKLLFDAYFRGQGLATALPAADMAFLRGTHAGPLPDIQILFVAAPMTAGPYLRPLWEAYADGFAARAVVLRPESRGSVELASSDPSHLAPDPTRAPWRESAVGCDRPGVSRSIDPT
jgi:choline dehydrogenase-like flavoprotein